MIKIYYSLKSNYFLYGHDCVYWAVRMKRKLSTDMSGQIRSNMAVPLWRWNDGPANIRKDFDRNMRKGALKGKKSKSMKNSFVQLLVFIFG